MSQFPPPPGAAPHNWMSNVPRVPFSFSNAFSQGWAAFKSNYGTALVAVLAAFGILIGAGIVNQIVQFILFAIVGAISGGSRGGAAAGGIGFAVVGFIGMLINLVLLVTVHWPTQASLAFSGVAVVRGEPVSGRSILRGFHKYTRSLKVMGLFTLFAMAIVIPVVTILVCAGVGIAGVAGRGGGGPRAGNAAGALLAVYPLVMIVLVIGFAYLTSRFGLAMPLALDDEVRPVSTVECFKMSWEMTKPKSAELFGLYVVLYFMFVISFFMLCFPAIFFTAPLSLCIVGSAYHQLAFDSGMFRTPSICDKCGYPVQPGMPVCPECGTSTAYATPTQFGAPPTNSPGAPNAPGQNPFPPQGPLPPQGPFSPQDPFAPRDPNGPSDPFAPRQ